MDTGLARRRLEVALLGAMDHAASNPMEWKFDNCVFWPANVIKDALGYDPVEDYRGAVSSLEDAKKQVGPLGLGFALKRAAKKYGWRIIANQDAEVGDVGVVRIGSVNSTVICRAPGWFLARSENGYTAIRGEHVRLIWSVLPK